MGATTYLCYKCRRTVRQPGQMGRSWCPECEDYLLAITIEKCWVSVA